MGTEGQKDMGTAYGQGDRRGDRGHRRSRGGRRGVTGGEGEVTLGDNRKWIEGEGGEGGGSYGSFAPPPPPQAVPPTHITPSMSPNGTNSSFWVFLSVPPPFSPSPTQHYALPVPPPPLPPPSPPPSPIHFPAPDMRTEGHTGGGGKAAATTQQHTAKALQTIAKSCTLLRTASQPLQTTAHLSQHAGPVMIGQSYCNIQVLSRYTGPVVTYGSCHGRLALLQY